MICENKPEFNDAFAKTKYKAHNTFAGKVVEILYGAKDAEGNPCMPKDGAEDGHGRWFGIEAGGVYQMFSWKKPAGEGGEVEYGTEYGDKALETMEEQLNKKRELCREAEMIGKASESDNGEARLAELKGELEGMPDWHTPKDAEYRMRMEKAEKAYASRIDIIRANRADKTAVLEQALALKAETNFNNAKKALRNLRGELSEIASAGEKTDDEIWEKFREVEKDLKEREDAYFSNLNENRAGAEAKKKALIEDVKKLTANVGNWKAAGEAMNAKFDEWKAAGSAGRDVDDELWASFNEIRQKFFDDRQKFFDERNEQWQASVDAKEALIKEAAAIAEEKNYDKAHTERMKQLDISWKKAGFSGKENNDRLWDEFNKAKDVFWSGKREQAFKRIQEDIDAKSAELEAAKKQLEDLEYRKTLDATPALQEGFERNIFMKKGKIAELEKAVEELKERLK